MGMTDGPSAANEGVPYNFDDYVQKGDKLVRYLSLGNDEAQREIKADRDIDLESYFNWQGDLHVSEWLSMSETQPIIEHPTSFWGRYSYITATTKGIQNWDRDTCMITQYHSVNNPHH